MKTAETEDYTMTVISGTFGYTGNVPNRSLVVDFIQSAVGKGYGPYRLI